MDKEIKMNERISAPPQKNEQTNQNRNYESNTWRNVHLHINKNEER